MTYVIPTTGVLETDLVTLYNAMESTVQTKAEYAHNERLIFEADLSSKNLKLPTVTNASIKAEGIASGSILDYAVAHADATSQPYWVANDCVGLPTTNTFHYKITQEGWTNGSSDYILLKATPYGDIKEYCNFRSGGTWGGWTTKDSLTISGSNLNGRYIEFGDGTMMQWGCTSLTMAVGFSYPTITMPSLFYYVDRNSFSVSVYITPLAHWTFVNSGRDQSGSTANTFCASMTNNGASQSVIVNWQAIGRWKA